MGIGDEIIVDGTGAGSIRNVVGRHANDEVIGNLQLFPAAEKVNRKESRLNDTEWWRHERRERETMYESRNKMQPEISLGPQSGSLARAELLLRTMAASPCAQVLHKDQRD
ncbi:hypothetical protein KM043_016137 [Ampulex compressa]|nr:hypothetical protein KM043_016137 [Ampulex compressa]